MMHGLLALLLAMQSHLVGRSAMEERARQAFASLVAQAQPLAQAQARAIPSRDNVEPAAVGAPAGASAGNPAHDPAPDEREPADDTDTDSETEPDEGPPPPAILPPLHEPRRIGPLEADGLTRDLVANGDHWRFETANGPVHVWRPAGYRPLTAGVVVYVHGFWTDVDSAWTEHHLAPQFDASHQNALFIVPEAPANLGQQPLWPSLGELLDTVHAHTGLEMPRGPLVIMGHSGAYRQLVLWLDNRHVSHVILLDALYAQDEAFRGWLESAPKAHELTVIANDTLRRQRRQRKLMRLAVRATSLPEEWTGFSKRQRSCRFLYIRSQYGHMEIVTQGKTIPLLLRRTTLARL